MSTSLRFSKKRRIFFAVLLICSIQIPTSSPSFAIFGLSKCEKVKKEIEKYEKNFNRLAIEVSQYVGQKQYGSFAVRDAAEKFQLEGDKLLFKRWKTAYNNPNCLTRTQNEYVKSIKDAKVINTWLIIDIKVAHKSSSYCKKDLNFLEEKCKYREDDIIRKVYTLSSVYDA